MTWMQGVGTWLGGMGGGFLVASYWELSPGVLSVSSIPLLVASVALNLLSVVLIAPHDQHGKPE